MPILKITNEDPIEISMETAKKIEEQLERREPRINIGNRIIKAIRIIEVNYNDISGPKKYDLDKEEDRLIIKDFENELENIHKQELREDVKFYGIPIREDKLVYNPLLGYEDPRIIQYCLDNRIIERKVVNMKTRWAILNVSKYEEWIEKMEAYKDLLYRRELAKKYEEESLNNL